MRIIHALVPLLVATLSGPAQTNILSDPGLPMEEAVSQAEAAETGKTNAPSEASGEAPEETPEPETRETHIYSDSVQLGIDPRFAVYRGNVKLEDPRIHLTCEQLSADVPVEGGRVERVVAETNVFILLIDEKGETNRVYADKAVYTYSATDSETNEVVELSGSPQPRIERPEGILYGDVIVWDRVRNEIRATNQRMIYRSEMTEDTNTVQEAGSPSEAPVDEAVSRERALQEAVGGSGNE